MVEFKFNVLVLTSMLFASVSIHALHYGLYAYGLAWFGLCITSSLTHGCDGLCRTIDKLLVYLVIVIGSYYYYQMLVMKKRLPWFIKVVPLVTFFACILMYHVYYDYIEHVWVHIASIIGHHVIIYGYAERCVALCETNAILQKTVMFRKHFSLNTT